MSNIRHESEDLKKPQRSTRPSGQTAIPVLSADFLNRHTNKNDLVHRLRKVVDALSDEDVEPNSPNYPGLGGLSAVLVEDTYLKHRDKEVRLYTVLACIEVLYLYAPDPPYDTAEILKIFPQVIQQIANLATCTSPSQPNFAQYFRLLEQLAVVNIGVVLVEMTKTLDSAEMGERSDNDDPTSEDALEVLRELIEVLLNCVHIDHPSDVLIHAVTAISGCIVEFDGGAPIPILDEILKCIGAGPFVDVTNPAFTQAVAEITPSKNNEPKKQKLDYSKLPPMYIQETNQSYLVARGVISKTVDRISSPIASLLNGLLSGEPSIIKQSNISSDLPACSKKGKVTVSDLLIPEQTECQGVDVWSIIYELHKVSSGILTTVVGTVASSLQHSDEEKRLRVTTLLGKLFSSKSSDIAFKFHVCYRSWLLRVSDKSSKIREAVVRHLIDLLKNKSTEKNLCEEAVDGLVKVLSNDPSVEIRLECIHEICSMIVHGDSSSGTGPFINAKMIQAVANRVSSKNKKERMDAVTGLAKIYHKKYLFPKVKDLIGSGSTYDIEAVIRTLKVNCDFNLYCVSSEKQGGKSKRSSSSPVDNSDYADEFEKYKFIPRVVFQSVCFDDSTDPTLRNRIIMLVDDVLLGTDSDSSKSDDKKPNNQKLNLTARALGLTILLNDLQSFDDGSGSDNTGRNSLTFKWILSLMNQRRKLQLSVRAYIEARTKADACKSGSEEKELANQLAFQKLEIVAALTSPPSALSSPGVSVEDIDKILPKLHGAKDKHIFRLLASIASPGHSSYARSRALDELPKRTKSLGVSVCVWVKTLAKRCAMGHFINSEIITQCASIARKAFLEGEYLSCRALLESVNTGVTLFNSIAGKEASESLTELFAECRGSLSDDGKKQVKDYGILTILSEMLAYVSKASPSKYDTSSSPIWENVFDDQIQKELVNLCTKDGTAEEAFNAVVTLSSKFEKGSEQQLETFIPILKTLTSSSKMCFDHNGSPNVKIVNILAALRAIAINVPGAFSNRARKSDPGSKAVRFALEHVLLGRVDRVDDSRNSDVISSSEDEAEPVMSSKKISKYPPKGKSLGADHSNLSLCCLRLIKSIEFLVSYSVSVCSTASKTEQGQVPHSDVASFVQALLTILEYNGQPPSARDSRECKDLTERAELRKCATINLLKLCSSSLRLVDSILTPKALHTVSKVFLDEDAAVRDAVLSELCCLLKAEGSYMKSLPKLSLLALVCFCPDSETSASATGYSGHVGRKANITKDAAAKCVNMLRSTSNNVLLQYRAANKEDIFESTIKMMLMPEFCVPYAFHLLVMRPETPSTDEKKTEDEEARYKLLSKRLKWLYDPLVLTLGDGADNISFLLRQAEILGTKYIPLSVDVDIDEAMLLCSKLRVVSLAAREVLLRLVKKDINLTTYPGSIQIPGSYFAVALKKVKNITSIETKAVRKSILSPDRSAKRLSNVSESGKRSVHFEKEDDDEIMSFASSEDSNTAVLKRSKRNRPDDFHINLSPIAQSASPESSAFSGSHYSVQSRINNKALGSHNTTSVSSTTSSQDNSMIHSSSSESIKKSVGTLNSFSNKEIKESRKKNVEAIKRNKENFENVDQEELDISTKNTYLDRIKKTSIVKADQSSKYKKSTTSSSRRSDGTRRSSVSKGSPAIVSVFSPRKTRKSK